MLRKSIMEKSPKPKVHICIIPNSGTDPSGISFLLMVLLISLVKINIIYFYISIFDIKTAIISLKYPYHFRIESHAGSYPLSQFPYKQTPH